MKVLLLTPINRGYVITPSLGLGYLASMLRQDGHDVEIYHSLKEKADFDRFERHFSQGNYDVAGIQMFTFDVNPVKRHLEIIKRISPQCVTILGGYHPSGDPYSILNQFPQADFAFFGEAEIGLPALLRELNKNNKIWGEIPSLIWRDSAATVVNPVQLVENLDDLPFPAWDLMDPRSYPEAPHGAFFKSFPNAPLIITRGCNMKCTFCAGKSITQERIRSRSVDNLIEEIKFLKSEYGVNEFMIEDENFTSHRRILRQFCDRLISERLNIHWSCPTGVRIDTLTAKSVALMEESGCYSLGVGIEFGSQRIHDLTKKGLSVERIAEKMALFKNSNMKVTGFFLLGIPGETREEMLETIRFAKSLDIDRAQFCSFMPLPGSEIYARQGLTADAIDYDRYMVHDVAYVPNGMSRREMKNLQRRAFLEFYLRPKVILNILREIKSFKHFYQLGVRFLDTMN